MQPPPMPQPVPPPGQPPNEDADMWEAACSQDDTSSQSGSVCSVGEWAHELHAVLEMHAKRDEDEKNRRIEANATPMNWRNCGVDFGFGSPSFKGKLRPRPPLKCPVMQRNLQANLTGAVESLQTMLPHTFWSLVAEMWQRQNVKYRRQLEEINAFFELSPQKTLLKWVSYYGAIRLPDWAAAWEADPRYPGMADVGNWSYAMVFRRAWCRSWLCTCKDDTIGDHVEALLGWHWIMVEQMGKQFPEQVEDIVQLIEQAAFSHWALFYYYGVK
jgi:hypothetical protein